MTSSYTRLVPDKARRVRIYRNGDGHYKGLNVVLNYKQGQDINTVLDTISERIGLVLGAKRLFSTDGTQITSTEQLEHNGEYVASSGPFTPLAYGQSPAINRLGQSGSLRRPRRDSTSRSTQENNSLGSSYSRSIERSEKAASAPKQRTKKIGSKKKVKEKAPPPEPTPSLNNAEKENEEEEAEVNQNGEETRSPEGTTEVEVIEHEQHDDEEKEEEGTADEQEEDEKEEENKEETTVTPKEEEEEAVKNEEEHQEEENVEEEVGEKEDEENRKNTPKTPT